MTETTKTAQLALQPAYLSRRGVLTLFLAVMVATFALFLLISGIERTLLRLVGAVFIVGGFGAIAMLLLQMPLQQVVGKRARLIQIVIALVAGAALWLPALWLNLIVNNSLNSVIGGLPLANEFTGASRLAVVIQFGIVIPLLHAFLFLGVIQRGSTWRQSLTGVIIVALLYGIYALLSNDLATSAALPYFLVAFVAALAVYFTDSMWTGAAVLIGYHVVRPLIDQTQLLANLQLFLLSDMSAGSDSALYGGRFLLLVLIGGFVSFLCLQMLRATVDQPAQDAEPAVKEPGRWWWLPLILLVLLLGVILYSEIRLRLLNPISDTSSPFTLTQ